VTTAIADQIVVTVRSAPPAELLRRLTAELQKLDAIDQLGAGGSPAAVAGRVADVQAVIEHELETSGLLIPNATPTQTPAASATPRASATPDASATPGATATATPEPSATPPQTPTPTPTPTPTATPAATSTATATATP
jgi:hypothetical protein